MILGLNAISEDIFYDEHIIKRLGNDIKVNFDFVKINNKLICKVALISIISCINYNDALKVNNEIIAPLKKIRKIESELNKKRFYFRNDTFEFLGNDEEYYKFLKHGIKEIRKMGEIKKHDKDLNLYKGNFNEFNIEENTNGNLKFSFNLEGIPKSEIESVINAYKNNNSYIKLEDGTYVDLTCEEFINVMKIIELLNLDIENNKEEYEIELSRMYYLNNMLKKNVIVNNKNKVNEVLNKIKNRTINNEFEVPKELNAKLREYQKIGYNWFRNLKQLGLGGVLCDEMGLGKTIQTIAFLLSEKEKDEIEGKQCLIIAPTSLIYNWRDEIIKFAPTLKIGIIHGNKKERENILGSIKEYNILLTTYGTLRSDYDKYKNVTFSKLVLDEGQNINNYKAQTTKIVKSLKSESRFVLTGTPIENNLNELWSLFDFIMPGYLYSKEKFNEKFIKNKNDNIDQLKILISPYILRRLKRDVVKELPNKIEKKCLIENTPKQNKLYKGFIKEVQNNINNPKFKKNNITIFSYLTKLRQICLDPSIVIDDYNGGSGKINYTKELILKHGSNHKILLFSQFTSVLMKFQKILQDEEIEFCYLDGNVTAKNRINIVDEFNNNKKKKVFLISLKAGGTGLNLTSADIVIHFDPWWNPSIEEQATDRAHRIGQKKVVYVLKLIAKDTIEEKILLLQENKKDLINSVITNELNDSNVVGKLNNEELLSLFK